MLDSPHPPLPDSRPNRRLARQRWGLLAGRLSVLSILMAFGALPAAPGLAEANDCQDLLKRHTESDMGLPYDRFDQTEGSGWRALERLGCSAEAAVLIERYLISQDSQSRNLRWHLAQMLAFSGDTAKAIQAAMASRNPDEDRQHPEFHWNDYVNATIAFLNRDRVSFDAARERLKKAAKIDPINQPNLSVLERLAACFEKPYKDAYDCKAGP